MEGLPHDIAVLDTCIRAVMDVWRAVPTPDVDSSGVCDRNAALRQDWPGLGTALDDLLGERVAGVMEIVEALLGQAGGLHTGAPLLLELRPHRRRPLGASEHRRIRVSSERVERLLGNQLVVLFESRSHTMTTRCERSGPHSSRLGSPR